MEVERRERTEGNATLVGSYFSECLHSDSWRVGFEKKKTDLRALNKRSLRRVRKRIELVLNTGRGELRNEMVHSSDINFSVWTYTVGFFFFILQVWTFSYVFRAKKQSRTGST